MKVQTAIFIKNLSGRQGNMVYCAMKDGSFTYLRRYVKPARTAANDRFEAIQKNLWNIHPSEAYKNDLRMYLQIFNRTKPDRLAPYQTWRNVWMVMLFEMQRLRPGVDLATITRQEIYDNLLPCINVASAVDANLIYSVPGYETLVSDI